MDEIILVISVGVLIYIFVVLIKKRIYIDRDPDSVVYGAILKEVDLVAKSVEVHDDDVSSYILIKTDENIYMRLPGALITPLPLNKKVHITVRDKGIIQVSS